jgi:drug/metabolite transporter (DMT)-like permease
LQSRVSGSTSPYLLLGLAILCVSFGSILVQLAQAPFLAVAFYRTGFATLFLFPFAWPQARASWPTLPRRSWLLMLAAGAALALHFATWIASLSFTSVAASVLLVNTTPIFSLVLGRIVLGERASASVVAGTGLALCGTAIIVHDDIAAGSAPLRGDLLALAGALTLSLYHLIGRGLRNALPLSAYVLGVWSSAACVLALLAAAFGAPFTGHTPRAWLCFIGLALVPTLAGHGLVNRALRHLPAPTVGLFMLGEPVGATLLALLVLGQRPSAATLAGGAVVLTALVFVASRQA